MGTAEIDRLSSLEAASQRMEMRPVSAVAGESPGLAFPDEVSGCQCSDDESPAGDGRYPAERDLAGGALVFGVPCPAAG
jgi:hypothetical protein